MEDTPSPPLPTGEMPPAIPLSALPLPLPPASAAVVAPQLLARVWGFWATMGLGISIIIGMVVGQSFGIGIYVVLNMVRGRGLDLEEISTSGLMLSLATLVALPVSVGMTWLFAWIKAKRQAAHYLGLKRTRLRSYIWGLGILPVVMLLWMAAVHFFEIEDVPPFVVDAYRTAEIYPLIWFAIVVAAPIMEEMLFRGFFFTGLLHSRAGAAGAIVIPSVIWAAMHLQYGIHEIVLIFVFGLLLGGLRLKTGSILPTIFVHAVSNLISTIEVAVLVAE